MSNTPLPLTDIVNESYTIPSAYYLSNEIYEVEKTHIFYKTWQYVAHKSFLSNVGDYYTLQICDQNIFVIRTDDNELKAFYNVCQHRAHELLRGAGNVEGPIVCPYHAWTYKKDGGLIAARLGKKRPDFDLCRFGLKEINLEVFCDCVFVNLDPNCESLNEIASDLAEDVKIRAPYFEKVKLCGEDLFGETVNKANWKVVVDNFLECYHCGPAHPDFSSLINMGAYQVDAYELWSRQIGNQIRNENSAYPVGEKDGNQFSIAWFLWPNTTFNVLPGGEEFSVYTVRPTGLDSCTFAGHSLTTSGEINAARAQYTSDILVPEDIGLCESVQRGLPSMGYDQGPFIYDSEREGISEHGLHHFHKLIYQTLKAHIK